jgi:trimeric autotransporter adhesin
MAPLGRPNRTDPLGTSAELNDPTGLAPDSDTGGIVISDTANNVIRILSSSNATYLGIHMTKNDIYTVVGNGTGGYLGDGGIASSAELNSPTEAGESGNGDIFISDSGNDRIRVVSGKAQTLFGIVMTKGDIYTVGGNGLTHYSGEGEASTGAELNGPSGVAATSDGSVAIADSGNNVVRYVAGSSATTFGISMTLGDIYTIGGNGIPGYVGNGGVGTSAEINFPEGVCFDQSGNVVVADTENNVIRVIAASSGTYYGVAMTAGDIYVIAGNGTAGYAGNGGAATSAELFSPTGVAVDAFGNVLIADAANSVIRVVASTSGSYYGYSMVAGNIYTIAGDNDTGFSGDGGVATSAELSLPDGVALDGSGNVVIADSLNNRVRVVANSTGMAYGISMTAGDIYTVAGNGTSGYSGDNGSGTSAELNVPTGVGVDPSGNILIADSHNNVVRLVAETSGTDTGMSVTAGDIYTVVGDGTEGFAGDGGTSWTSGVELNTPLSVATDSSGDVFIADYGNNRIRMV